MTGVERIAAERARQIEEKGWTAEHDARHSLGDLALAAACYALPPATRNRDIWDRTLRQLLWPWGRLHWRPTADTDRIRELEKAGALIAAEIDRLIARRDVEQG